MWGRYLREKPQWLPKPQRGLILGFLFKKNSQHPSLFIALLLLVSSAGCANIKTEMPTEYAATPEKPPEVTPRMLDELARTEAEFGVPNEANRELLIATSSAGRNPVSASVSASAINRMPMIGQLILHDMRTELLALLRQFPNGTVARDLEGQSGLFVPQPGGENENYLFWLLLEQLIGAGLVEKRPLEKDERGELKKGFWIKAI